VRDDHVRALGNAKTDGLRHVCAIQTTKINDGVCRPFFKRNEYDIKGPAAGSEIASAERESDVVGNLKGETRCFHGAEPRCYDRFFAHEWFICMDLPQQARC